MNLPMKLVFGMAVQYDSQKHNPPTDSAAYFHKESSADVNAAGKNTSPHDTAEYASVKNVPGAHSDKYYVVKVKTS